MLSSRLHQVLVRKSYPNWRRKAKPRMWKLQRMAIGASEGSVADRKRETARSGYACEL